VNNPRRTRWAEHVARTGEKINEYTILVEKPEGKEKYGKPTRRWQNNIKMQLKGMKYKAVHWTQL